MSDLVKRLRQAAVLPSQYLGTVSSMMRNAADAIERLEVDRRHAEDLVLDQGSEIGRLKAERDRLRAALAWLRSYHADTIAGRINYRPRDHIQVIDAALAGGEASESAAKVLIADIVDPL